MKPDHIGFLCIGLSVGDNGLVGVWRVEREKDIGIGLDRNAVGSVPLPGDRIAGKEGQGSVAVFQAD